MDLTPQQQSFLKAYLDPKSPTWGNALQSALSAGYSQEYSESITHQMPDWLAENLGKTKVVQKAQKNLELALEGGMDEAGKKQDIMWKATDFTLSRLKPEDFAEKHIIAIEDKAKIDSALDKIL